MCWEKLGNNHLIFDPVGRKSKFYMLINSIQFGGERVKQLGPKKEKKSKMESGGAKFGGGSRN